MWGSHEISEQQLDSTTQSANRPELGTLYVVSAPNGVYVSIVKPTIDRIIAGAVLILVLPVMAMCMIAVRINLGSPIFFSQERVGRDGRRFKVYKFRTMHHDRRGRGDDRGDLDQQRFETYIPEPEPLELQDAVSFVGDDRRKTHKSPIDPRLTGVGRFLRKWSLDELPQLWNVVRGDMSIIGPRPELPQIVANYKDWEHARHMVKPGLTGLWQVSARGEGRPMHEHIGIDVEYVAGLNVALDLKIMVRTPIALITKRGF